MEGFVDTDKKFAGILFDVLVGKGVRDVVCSPGSRNAPLLIAAAARKELRKHVVIDERSAAFMALGMSGVGRKPVALVCTSGTALLNYGPAIAEAFYQRVPLIVISADRPEQWIDQDDSQTLRQFEAFSNYVKKSYELPAWGDDDSELQWYANRIANDAVIEATSRRKGPVHINVRIGEPIGGKSVSERRLPRIIDLVGADVVADSEAVRRLALRLVGRKVMFVAGFMRPDVRMQKAASEFCSLPGVAVMAETLANLHLGPYASAVDSVLTAYPEQDLDRMAPEIVISVGGALVSRKLKEYLRRNAGRCEHWSLGWHHTTSDCFRSLTLRVEADPARMLRGLAFFVGKEYRKGDYSGSVRYSAGWLDMKAEADKVKESFICSSPWSELKAFGLIFRLLPARCNLFLSNGTTVRYAQLSGKRMPHSVYCNRGVSGIDGSISTAIGGAKMYSGMTVIVTGDMSMAYDIGSFGLPDIPDTVRIIVMDNGGGGIFRFIPSTSTLPEREEYFCVAPVLPLRQLADGYGWDYLEAYDEEECRKALEKLFSSGRRSILRIVCDGETSASVLKEYMQVKV